MKHIAFSFQFTDNHADETINNPLVDLLDAIDRHGSLAAAVDAEYDCSYRHMWNEVKQWETQLGRPLMLGGRGKPAQLSPFAKKLLDSVRAVQARHKPQIEAFRTDLLQAYVEAIDAGRPVLAFAGCRDVAIMLLRKAALNGSAFFLDVNFNSSLRGLEDLYENRTQITGFNFPMNAGMESTAAQSFRKYLVPKEMMVIHFCTRIQGIAVAKGNPLGLHSLLDVSLKKARYAQRVKGSGTRILFEDLLHASGMTENDIITCGRTADSHIDVATLIAQGQADAGICLANIAADAGLDFIPLSREIYLMACRNDLLKTKEGKDFLALLNDDEWKAEASRLPGYDFSDCGRVLDVGAALPWF